MRARPAVWLVLLALGPAARAQGPGLEAQLLREDPAALAKAARAQGDPVRGAVLFHQPHLSCTKCHATGGATSPFGPDLARPEPGTTDAHLVEAVLNPSKAIRKGFETVTVTRTNGSSVSGLVVDDGKDSLVLRDPAKPTEPVTIPKADVEDRTTGKTSLMPAELTNLLTDRRQFLDLVCYLIEIAEFGPARARSLRPDPDVIDPPLPAYEKDLDHAGLIAGLDGAALKRGAAVYGRLCVTCHGTKDQPGSMPTSLAFWSGKFRNGSDPFAMYQTVTRGSGLMPRQPALVPREKYDVIHYIRETYLRPHNPTQYAPVDAAYMARLPKGSSRGPVPPERAPWAKMDYGPTLGGTFEVGKDGTNIAYKGLAVRLDPGPGGVAAGRAWMLYELDTLRAAGAWTGKGFLDWRGVNFDGAHDAHPHAVGKVHFETTGPGWANPETGSFDDPRPKGRDGKPYGPFPKEWMAFRGLYHAGDRAVLSYRVGDTDVLESPGLTGTEAEPVFTRSFEVGPRSKDLVLMVARTATTVTVGTAEAPADVSWQLTKGSQTLVIPAGKKSLKFTVWLIQSGITGHLLPSGYRTPDLAELTQGGPARWKNALTTRVERGNADGPFAVDVLPVPEKNPWRAQMRLSGLDFTPDASGLYACTWDGNVWKVTGLERADGTLTWRRIASGLFQPLGLKVVGQDVYVTCRDQIVILQDKNADGETDFYECFNTDHQVTEHFHEFAMGLQTDAAGNFYYTKGARHAKTAVVPQHGTLLRVSKDGSKTDILATGLRAPNGVCVNPDGTFFVTDQEGHWIPKNRVNWIRPGRFYGNAWGYRDGTDTSDDAMEPPVCWITNRFNRSPGEIVRVEGKTWGPLAGSLLDLSYGTGKVFVIPHEKVGEHMHGGMVALPIPAFPTGVMRGRFHPKTGDLYCCGMFAWAGDRQVPGGLYRIRPTGKPMHLPTRFHATRDGLALTFTDPLAPDSVKDEKNFGLKVWDLKRSGNYGSPHLNERALKVSAASLSADRKTLTLTVPGLGPTRGLELWYSVTGADGRPVDGLYHGSILRMGE